jgi:dsRNA-specific ribonuclease
MAEGKMTLLRKNATKNETIAKFSKELELINYAKLGKSLDVINDKFHADLFEAFLGALYQDGHESIVDVILDATVFKTIMNTIANPNDLKNPKTKLQELAKVNSMQDIIYKTHKSKTKKVFIGKVQIDKITFGKGEGKTKQKAEIAAGLDALSKLKK